MTKTLTPKVPNTGARRAVTIESVARAAGTSLSTASMALNGKARVSPETRRLVLQAAQDLGYESNYYAQRLRGNCTNLIGLFSADLDWVGTSKIKMIQRLLAAQGYDVPVYSYGSYGGGEQADEATLMNSLRRQKPQAIICYTSGLEADALHELHRFHEDGGQVVCFGYPEQEVKIGCDQVIFDTEDNTFQAARHLLQLGHRQVGLYVPGARKENDARLVGFRRAFQEFGLEVRNEWLFHHEGLYEEGGARMADRFLQLQQRPTGLCIVNDVTAAAFVNQAIRGGLRVPEDVSVVSHDDLPAARYCIIPLTAVSHPLQEIASQVADLLLSRLSGDYSGAPRRVVIRGELNLRQSSTLPQFRSEIAKS